VSANVGGAGGVVAGVIRDLVESTPGQPAPAPAPAQPPTLAELGDRLTSVERKLKSIRLAVLALCLVHADQLVAVAKKLHLLGGAP
jgi:hypothetical protein